MQTREEKLAYQRKYNAERRAFLREHGLCAWCGKEKAEEGKVLCWQCAIKDSERHERVYYSLTEEERKEKNRKGHERAPLKRQERKAQGLCPRCGHTAVKGSVLCLECRIKARRNSKEYGRKHGAIPFELRGNGYCYRCCKPVESEGSKLCNECYAKHVERAEKMREKVVKPQSWQNDNILMFGRYKNDKP